MKRLIYLILPLLLLLLFIGTKSVIESISIGASKITYNTDERTLDVTSGIEGTTNQLGTELWNNLVVNNSGEQIDNGKAVYATGIQGDSIMEIALASNTSSSLAGRTLGLATGDIPDGGYGFVTRYGYVRDFNTSALNLTGGVYLGTNGDLTMTKPTPPSVVKVMGGLIYSHASDGIFTVAMSDIAERIITGKGYNFTSNGVGAGTFWKGGFYDWSATDANLNEGSTTVTYGTADDGYSAHGSVVCGGAGSVNTGVVGLRVTGTSITDAGVLTPGDADTIISDITAVATDEFYEAKKFVGTTTYELITMSGSPTTYSLDFNYGYSKYEDLGNRDFYLTGLECIWQGGAADATTFDIILLHHKTTGWTYAASGFVAGDGSIAQRSVDQAGFLRVENGVDGAWKRTNINQFINGNGSEGIMFKIITGANGTIQTMDMHVGVAVD